MKIKIFTDIEDKHLKMHWERIEAESHVFPQSTYQWCSTWWRNLGGKKKLHIVTIYDKDNIQAIAPLCIQKQFKLSIIRSIPIQFGDFYSFIIAKTYPFNVLADMILDYLDSLNSWHWVRIEQVAEENQLYQRLVERGYLRKKLTGCIHVDFDGLDWDSYLFLLKKKMRSEVRRRLRNIETCFDAKLAVISDWNTFCGEFENMLKVHRDRWKDDYIPPKGSKAIACLRDAIKGQFSLGNMVYYQLIFNNQLVAYRLGFIHDRCYYAWNTSFNTEYRKYHVGSMIIAYMIRHFIEVGVSKINFMAGEYDWKFDWSPNREVVANYMFTSHSVTLPSQFLNWYFHSFRERLKDKVHKAIRNSKLRFVYRNMMILIQKISGRL